MSQVDDMFRQGTVGGSEAQTNMLAAEALVDAALICSSLVRDDVVPADERRFLIEAVCKEPALTGQLLSGALFEFQRC